MSNRYSSGKYAIAECDRCGQQYDLKRLKIQILKTKPYNIKVCQTCWDPDHPQLQLGMYPVNDPQAVREPRPDTSYLVSGLEKGGSRVIQWGWNPVGGARANDAGLTPNNLVLGITLGSVTVTTV